MLETIKCGNYELKFDKTLIMGILNITPDSFSDGGKFVDFDKAISHTKKMVDERADIIDVGGESSRPGSDPVSGEEELRRVLPLIEKLSNEIKVPISIDTYKPNVADKCIKAGACIINDISGLRNEEMIKVAAKHKVPVVVMHMKGTPKNMQVDPKYDDVVIDIKHYLQDRIDAALKMGVNDIIIDPGIGFGKTVEGNLEIIKRLEEFEDLDCPILVGPSRKSFIGKISNLEVDERLEGTIASICVSIMNGANIVRVHDVKECRRAIEIVDAIKRI